MDVDGQHEIGGDRKHQPSQREKESAITNDRPPIFGRLELGQVGEDNAAGCADQEPVAEPTQKQTYVERIDGTEDGDQEVEEVRRHDHLLPTGQVGFEAPQETAEDAADQERYVQDAHVVRRELQFAFCRRKDVRGEPVLEAHRQYRDGTHRDDFRVEFPIS